jgi:hypothetical protein
MRATNGIPLRCSLLLPVGTVNCVDSLKGYYVPRVRLIKEQALDTITFKEATNTEHGPAATPLPENLNTTKDARLATLAYKFQTAFGNGYALEPVYGALPSLAANSPLATNTRSHSSTNCGYSALHSL